MPGVRARMEERARDSWRRENNLKKSTCASRSARSSRSPAQRSASRRSSTTSCRIARARALSRRRRTRGARRHRGHPAHRQVIESTSHRSTDAQIESRDLYGTVHVHRESSRCCRGDRRGLPLGDSIQREGGRCEGSRRRRDCDRDAFLPDVYVTCGNAKPRYNREDVDVQFAVNRSLTARADRRSGAALSRIFADCQQAAHVQSVGLGYIELGQSATTLSVENAASQAVERALAARHGRTLYILTSPQPGCTSKTRTAVDVLNKLVDQEIPSSGSSTTWTS